ncbi:hypothetical protein CWI38_0058p0010 [Hamiltosporidium tvaerminnensis]|uniref:Uncharacterized protein n=1 Tax=Hamiltosporidium tvaerminnensis TaxID=1176355 RepID=A0A4Q9M1J3_9MICR|nr:hypothetical protein CWI38_0058p0010 [Hamiltosporidium tvaerminnensis]
MLLQLLDLLISKVENTTTTHLVLKKNFLKVKYRLLEELKNVGDSFRWLKRGTLGPEMKQCRQNGDDYIKNHLLKEECNNDRRVFWGAGDMCQHIGKSGKLNIMKQLHHAEIKVNTRTKTYVKIWNIRSDFFLDKKKNKNTDIEVGNIYQDLLKIVETEKLRKYDSRPMRCILFVIEFKEHKSRTKRQQIPHNIETYIHSIILKKTVKKISFDLRRGLEKLRKSERTHPLKQAKNDENAVKINIRNNTPDISGERTTCDELTININKKSDLE